MDKRTPFIKRHWRIIRDIAILLILAVLFLPLPIHIEQEMHGAVVSADGQIEDQLTVRVSGWQLRYLLRDDALRIKLDSSAAGLPLMDIQTLGPIFPALSSAYSVSAYQAYRASSNATAFGYLALRTDQRACCLTLGDGMYLVAAAEKNQDLAAVLEQCRIILN